MNVSTHAAHTSGRDCIRVLGYIVLLFAVHGSLTANAESPTSGPIGKTYRNPVIETIGLADPDVLKVDDVYYLYATSHGKGFDAYVSDDLVHWENRGVAFDDPRGGAWAPDLYRAPDGKFYLYYTDNSVERNHRQLLGEVKQIGVASAASPLGPFTDHGPLANVAIDAHLFEDTDGKLYLYYVDLKDGFRIVVQPMADPLTPTGQLREVLRPSQAWEKRSGDVTEGPFVLKRGDTYYLTYSGTRADSPNYAIGYATATSPLGPFEKYKNNPIVERSETVLGPGHHCVVIGPRGDLWMLYHQKVDDKTNFQRFVALDPMWFDDAGALHARATRGVSEICP
jgi:xylan 1,4-beta-xylosidase